MVRQGLLMLLLVAALPAQSPTTLREGQQVTLHGTLVMRPGGRLQFVAVHTTEAYLPMVGGREAKSTQELGLSNYHRYDLLYAHRGQAVIVRGTVSINDASPYYLHNVSLKVASIRLADGTELVGKPRTASRIAVDVGEYQASVALPADLEEPWQYRAQGSPDMEQRFLTCSSNGGGDVVNCFCADGFHPLHARSTTRGVDAQVLADMHMAQFGVGDDARRVELAVTCSR